jgi:hypothetical protein
VKKRFICIQLAGGLGNQLFIWHYAHILSEEYNFRVLLLDFYQRGSDRECELYDLEKVCKHDVRIIKVFRVFDIYRMYDFTLSRKYLKGIAKFISLVIYTCKDPSELPAPELIKNRFFLRGYFQNAICAIRALNYTREEIHQLFSSVLASLNNLDLNEISQVLHVRRGDFRKNVETLGLLTDEYFLENMESDLPFIVHTDELVNIQSRLYNKASRVYRDNISPWSVVFQGANAKIFLGSNSTLSWWAIALNNRNDAVLKLPKPWYLIKSRVDDSLHLEKVTYVKARFSELSQC